MHCYVWVRDIRRLNPLNRPMHIAFQIVALASLLLAAQPVLAQRLPIRSCHVEIADDAGVWHVDRKIGFDDGKPLDKYDKYEWTPHAAEQLADGLSLQTRLRVRALVATRLPKVFAGSDTALDMSFSAKPRSPDEKLKDPGYVFLHFYRSSDPSERKSVFDTSLTTRMFSSADGKGNLSLRSVLSMEDVTVFGEGRDVLVWNVRSKLNEVGGTNSLLEGTLPIAAIRARISRIPELRHALDRRTARFRKDCPELLIFQAVSPG